MSNGTGNKNSEAMRKQLHVLVGTYHGLLCADERRLLEAMLEFERSVWAESRRHAA